MHELGRDANEAETARARAQLKAGLLMGLESPSQRAEQIARQILIYGRAIPVAEMIAKVDAVDAERVRHFARGVTSLSQPAFAALGPVSRLDPYTMPLPRGLPDRAAHAKWWGL